MSSEKAQELSSLKQGSGSVCDYAIRFGTLAGDSGGDSGGIAGGTRLPSMIFFF
jgi:hypothetical protein